MRKTIAIDFDGVLHRYSDGWHNGEIYDGPMKDSHEALQILSKHYDLAVVTARSEAMPVYSALKEWYPDIEFTAVTNRKVKAFAYIDDRGVRFQSWAQALKALEFIELTDDWQPVAGG